MSQRYKGVHGILSIPWILAPAEQLLIMLCTKAVWFRLYQITLKLALLILDKQTRVF